MVKEKRYQTTKKNLDQGRLRIFSLEDLETPVLDESKKMDFTKIQTAFWITKVSALCTAHKDENDTIIILRCADREHQI